MGSNAIGEIPVIITGDFSKLDDALNDSIIAAELGGQKIASAFTQGAKGADELGVSLNDIASSARVASMSAADFSAGLDKLIDQKFGATTAQDAAAAQKRLAQDMQSSADASKRLDDFLNANGFKAFTEQTKQSQEAMQRWNQEATQAASGSNQLLTTLLGFAGITVGVEALKDFALAAIESYAAIEKSTVALTALTGSVGAAESAISGLKDLALQDALSFPSLLMAEQRMVAFGVAADKIPASLRTIADIAAATGKDFNTVANVFERVIETGTLQSRTLVQLGINMRDLAAALGVTESEAKKAFAALDQSERIRVLEEATGKFAGTAEKVAQTLSGQWQTLVNQATFAMQDFGKAIAPVAVDLLGLATDAIKAADQTAQAFKTITDADAHLSKAAADTAATLRDSFPQFRQLYEQATAAGEGLDKAAAKSEAAHISLALISAPASAAADGLELIATALDLINTKAPNASTLLDNLHKGLENLTHSSTTSGSAFQEAWKNSQHFAEGISAVHEAQSKANVSLDTAQRVYNAYAESLRSGKPLLDGHVATQQEVSRAYKELQDAIEKADIKLKSHVLSYVDLIAKNKEWAAEIARGEAVVKQAQAADDGSAKSKALLAEAIKQLVDIRKKASDQELDAQTIALETITKEQQQIDKANALADAIEILTGKYGPQSLAVREAQQAYDKFIASLNLLPSDLQRIADGLQPIGPAFKQLGITGSEQLELLRQKAADSFHAIADSGTASLGDIRKAQEASIAAQEKWRDSLTPTADAFRTLGITSTQALIDARDQMDRAFADITASGKASAGDIYEAFNRLRDINRTIQDAFAGTAGAFKELGITSTLTLQREAEDAQRAYERIRDSGTASWMDIQQAQQRADEALQRYRDNLAGVNDDHGRLRDVPPLWEGIATSIGSADKALLQYVADLERSITSTRNLSAATGSLGNIGGTGGGADEFINNFSPGTMGGSMGSFDLFDPAHPEKGGWTITWSTESGTGYPIAKMTYHQPYNLPPLAPGQSNTDFRNIFGQHPPSTGGAATPPAPAPDILGAYGGTSIPADMLKAFVDGTISADQLTAALQALAAVTQTSTRATADTQQTLQSATSDTSFALTGLSNAAQSTQQAVPQIVETLQSSFGKLESVTADTVSQLQVYQDYLKSINDLNSQIQAENAARHAQALSDAGAFPNAKIRLGLPDIPAAIPLPPSAFTPSGNINDFVIPAGRTTMMTVNINNPTIANQSVADRLVTQLRDMGMRT